MPVSTIVLIAIIGSIVLAICIVTLVVVSKVRSVAKDIARTATGTSNIAKAISEINRQNAEYDATPKSVSGMTTLLLPRISRDFPNFEYNEAKSRAEQVLTSFLKAVDAQNAEVLSEGTSELKKKLRLRIDDMKGVGKVEHFRQIKIHQTEITQYTNFAGKCIITFQMGVEYFTFVQKSNGEIISGDENTKKQTRYNIDMIYIQDRELAMETTDEARGMNCPNCGAPLKMLGAKTCHYCGSAVFEINIHAWNFSDVKEYSRR